MTSKLTNTETNTEASKDALARMAWLVGPQAEVGLMFMRLGVESEA